MKVGPKFHVSLDMRELRPAVVDLPFGTAGLIGFVIRYTSLAQAPPLPFLQLLALPYLRYPLRFVAAAHQPPFWTAKMIIFLCLAT